MEHQWTHTRVAFGVSLIAALGCSDGDSPSSTRVNAAQGALGPAFPGAGTSGAGQSLAAGGDALGCTGPSPLPSFGPAKGATAHMTCLYGEDPKTPEASIEWIVESAADDELVHVRLTLNPDFCDNTYGANAIGWNAAAAAPATGPTPKKAPKAGHTFKDLVGSDHAEFKLRDADGKIALQFKLDYISESEKASSGYATLGVTGGEGKVLSGDGDAVVAASTSLDRNLNACGLSAYTTDSPATDASYSAPAAAPLWDYRVVYDVWVKRSAFGAADFGSAAVDFVHASPSKRAKSSVDVVPGKCPPSWPPTCTDPDSCRGGDNCYWAPAPPCDADNFRCSTDPVWSCGDVDAGAPTPAPQAPDSGTLLVP